MDIKYEKIPVFTGKTYFKIAGKLILGKNIVFASGIMGNVVGHSEKNVIVVSRNSKLSIGDNCGISNCTIVCTKGITIEDNVFIGGGSKIYDTDFHSITAKERLSEIDKNISKKNINIRKNAFIGGHTILLKGITIGENAVIGAGSLVSKDIPKNEVWAGNPIKYIKSLPDNL